MAVDFTPLTYQEKNMVIEFIKQWLETYINWNAIGLILIIGIIIWIYRAIKKSKLLGKMGMNTNNLILMGNLKNILNSYPDEKQEIYKKMYRDIVFADTEQEEIYILNTAIDKLKTYTEDKTNGTV